MKPVNDIEIKARKRQLLFIMLPSIYFALFFGKNIFDDLMDEPSFDMALIINIIINALLAAISGIISLYAIKRWNEKGPGLVLNKIGIIDNSGIVSAGMIFWSDVEEINSNKVIFTDCIIIKVKNPERYIRNQKSLFKQIWLGLENKYFGSPVNISVGGLQIKSKILFGTIQQHFLSSQVETRTYNLQREKEVIQQEKAELVDSINYAKRIQTALLPSHAKIQEKLGESFILFIPKDIVSGDFYWVEIVNEWVFFAGCDCTGHGVPGALISIVCNNALNRAVKEYGLIQPSLILDKVAELIVENLGIDGEVKDGMDASVCAFNNSTRELYWAGANIPLWIARQTSFYELQEYKPDKQPIGQVENRFPYTNHKIDIKKGDILYLFSDGYADQFGGDQGKKLTKKRFKELLLMQKNNSMEEQQASLLKFHHDYKNHSDQIDDILVMGIKIEH